MDSKLQEFFFYYTIFSTVYIFRGGNLSLEIRNWKDIRQEDFIKQSDENCYFHMHTYDALRNIYARMFILDA